MYQLPTSRLLSSATIPCALGWLLFTSMGEVSGSASFLLDSYASLLLGLGIFWWVSCVNGVVCWKYIHLLRMGRLGRRRSAGRGVPVRRAAARGLLSLSLDGVCMHVERGSQHSSLVHAGWD